MSVRNSGVNNPFHGKRHTPETIDKISEKCSAAWTRSDYRQAQHERLVKQTGENNSFFGRRHDEETRQRMSETRAHAISDGRVSCGPRGRKGTYTSIKTGVIERYDSFFELLRMQLLDADDRVISWTKCHGIRIPYHWNGDRKYVPDFQVRYVEMTVIEEIKGYEHQEMFDAKMQALQRYCAEHQIEMRYIDYEILELMVQAHFGASIATLRRKQ